MQLKKLIVSLLPIISVPLKLLAKLLDWCSQETYKEPQALAKLRALHEDSQGSCLLEKPLRQPAYDVAIIVPCYNVEAYVADCIASILQQQTRYSYKVILIDDGSTDKTGAILDSYAEQEKITVVHQENQGLAQARNVGLQLSAGKYVLFVDSDDRLAANALETLVELAYRTQKKIINGNYVYIDTEGKVLRTNPDFPKTGPVDPLTAVPGFAWGKLYAAELFARAGFPKGYWFEDTQFRKIICKLTRDCYNTEQVVYHYRYRPQSISKAVKTDVRLLDSLYVYLQLHKDSKLLGLSFEQSDYDYLLEHILYTGFRTMGLPRQVQKLVFCAWREFLEQEQVHYTTDKVLLQPLEQSLREGKFWSYLVICLTTVHRIK